MTRTAVGLALAGFATSVSAQNLPIQATRMPPLQQQMPPLQEQMRPFEPPPTIPHPGPPILGPALQGFPKLPGPDAQNQGPAQGQEPAQNQRPPQDQKTAAPAVTVERHDVWVPAGAARLQALDKVNAQASELTIKVGQSATFGSLTIKVRSCMVRPPDQPADAAAYLDATDSHPDSPGFDGWILESEPSVSMMQHPIYDLRVTGCT